MNQVDGEIYCGIAFCASLAFFKSPGGTPLCSTCGAAFELGQHTSPGMLTDIPRDNFNRLIKPKRRKVRR